ncbi:MAG TPA: DUF58 domain-containing protein [Fluviicola sp.]|nr:DUF58 domain-containing protein [Fluviicola sp.]
MDKEAILKRIRTIELQTRGLTQHVFSGQYQSAFKGRGMSFSEVRAYQIGDDVRKIDWNVTARFKDPYVKVFEEERELSVLLIIDVSGSMYYGQGAESKITLAAELAATIAFSAAQSNDKVAAIFLSDKIEAYIPPTKGFAHAHVILRKLLHLKPKSKQTSLSNGLQIARSLLKQRSICFIISDFNDELPEKEFSKTAQKHDLIALGVEDPAEKVLPNLGLVQLFNAETNTQNWIDSSSPKVQKEYAQQFETNKQNAQEMFAKNNINAAFFEVGKPAFNQLYHFFKARR